MSSHSSIESIAGAIADAFPPLSVSDDMERRFRLKINEALIAEKINPDSAEDYVDLILEDFEESSEFHKRRQACVDIVNHVLCQRKPL